jgi:Lrp/AsnC family leucine-responsive transcriptional regulator
MAKKLDAFDIALINRLQVNNLATAEELGRAVSLSPSSVSRRIKRLQENGAIEANVAIVAAEITPGRLHAVVRIQTHEHAEAKGIASLRARLTLAREVQMLFTIGGDFDLLVLVVTRGMEGYNAFAAQVLTDPSIRRYETSFFRAKHKYSTAIWLDDKDVDR